MGLLPQWGRIGARGRIVAERFESMALAADALEKHAQQKTRRGYGNRVLIVAQRKRTR